MKAPLMSKSEPSPCSHQKILYLVKLLERGFSFTELVNDYDYEPQEVRIALEIRAYLLECFKRNMEATPRA